MNTIIHIIIFIFSIVCHEVAHGYAALLCGDSTAKDEGRITLNPIPHIDLWWSILMPLMCYLSPMRIMFGGAKPVPVNPLRFYNRRLGMTLVSAAGPLTNISLALIAAFILNLLLFFNIQILLLYKICTITILYNLLLAFFNLVPIPPLDGSKILIYFLPPAYEDFTYRMQFYSMWILITIVLMGGFNFIYRLLINSILILIPQQLQMILNLLL